MKLLFFIAYLFFTTALSAQTQLKVYHGGNGESQVYNELNNVINKPKIKLKQGDLFSVKVLNANPLFYNYSLKYENLVIESEDKAITDLLVTFNTILATRSGTAAFTAKTVETDQYKAGVNTLITDINLARDYIRESDKPEGPDDALVYRRTAGLRQALDKIAAMSNAQFHFHNSNLLNDLNGASDKASVDEVEKEAFRLLNSSLVQKVNEIKKNTDPQTTVTIWQNEFKVTDTATKITLLINKIDKNNATLIRDGNGATEFPLEIATIIPYYKRATLELVPVANFIFSRNVREFYLENNIIQNRLKPKTTVSPGVVLNINFANFGETKEMSVGIGPGYKFNSKGDGFENFYLSTLLSYKNFLRIGLGVGFAQFPMYELKGGGKVGQPLPTNISNLNDLIEYEEKASGFLTIAFTGLNLSKKK